MEAASQTGVTAGSFPWTAEGVIPRLTELWSEEGKSAALIAKDLTALTGVEITRNAVIGKAHRLGLKQPGKSERAAAPPLSESLDSAQDEPDRPGIAAAPPALDPVERLPFRPPEPHLPGVTLFEARPFQCRWIISPDGTETRFCGEPFDASNVYSWCPDHMKMGVDQRSTDRRRADHDRAQKLRLAKAKAA